MNSIQISPGGTFKTQIFRSLSQITDSVGLGVGPRICISNKLPGFSNVVGGGPHFKNQCHIIVLTSEHSSTI